ncbi:MAG: multidrug efflux SMR transporter [Paludibacteraceae bacterium]|nr:multidrug efflux SMR transporter [Paludibacteraceae bacterium]
MKNYLFLLGAIILETIATSALNKSEQFSRLVPTLITLLGYGLSFFLMSYALKTIPVGIAYAIWSALGIVLIVIVSAIAFKQIPDWPMILGGGLIIAGVVIINLFSKMTVH